MQRDSTTQSIITGDVFKSLCKASVSFKSLTSIYTRNRGLPLSVGQYHVWFFFCLSYPHCYTAKPASPSPRAADFRMQRHSSLLFASFSSGDAETAGYSFHSPKKMESKPVVSKISMICGPTFSRITPFSEFFFMMSSTRSPAEDMY